MTLPPRQLARLLCTSALAASYAMAQPAANRGLIVLDPAHGGQDHGVSLGGALEKDVTLTFAATLRQSLAARGFNVVLTREGDPPATLPPDERAGNANHLRPGLCLVLHATASGNGVHVITSLLAPPALDAPSTLPWESAQAPFILQSLRVANDLALAVERARLPVLLSRATLRPLDNLTCPAVAVELAPLLVSDKSTPATDTAYQHRVADALTAALVAWRSAGATTAGGAP